MSRSAGMTDFASSGFQIRQIKCLHAVYVALHRKSQEGRDSGKDEGDGDDPEVSLEWRGPPSLGRRRENTLQTCSID